MSQEWMNATQQLFLSILRMALKKDSSNMSHPIVLDEISENTLKELWELSEIHHVFPLVFDAICRTRCFADRAELKKKMQERALQEVTRQLTQDGECLVLIRALQRKGYNPIIVKGIICRQLYPMPCLRQSVDEDFFVPGKEFAKYDSILSEDGMDRDHPDKDPNDTDELSYHKKGSPLYIELHKKLFSQETNSIGDLNSFFEDAIKRAVTVRVQDLEIRTIDPTDHLLFLILHAFKHFLHSGFGIRQVCDIGLMADRYSEMIQWNHVGKCLEQVKAMDFSRAIFRIVHRYLIPESKMYGKMSDWHIDSIDEGPLLMDIFDSGVLGASSVERLHSSNMTLAAVKDESTSSIRAAIRSFFLPGKTLAERYSYLKRAPFLLPVAWFQRGCSYSRELMRSRGLQAGKRTGENRTAESIMTGKRRIQLLEYYHII